MALGAELLTCIAESLPSDITARLTEPLGNMIQGSGQSMLRVLHYPPVPAGASVLRAAPHEDINLLTLLPAADGPGLELQLRGGEWVSVPYKPDQLIVNVEMAREATGSYLPSTTHRVAAPEHGKRCRSYVIAVVPSSASRGRIVSPLFCWTVFDERLNELGVV